MRFVQESRIIVVTALFFFFMLNCGCHDNLKNDTACMVWSSFQYQYSDFVTFFRDSVYEADKVATADWHLR